MALLCLKLITPAAYVDELSDQLIQLGAAAVNLQAATSEEIFQEQPHEHLLWQETELQALFEDEEALNAALIFCKTQKYIQHCSLEQVAEKNWVEINQKNFPPILFGDKLWVCPSWHDAQPLTGKILKLDPGMAFGTGTHATTALCLNFLATHDLHHKIVIDYGCGSGILALAAAILGAKKVIAVDHDEQALLATQLNAEKNNIAHQLEVVTAKRLTPVQANLVIANILANPLIELSKKLIQLTQKNGTLVLSGILAAEKQKIIDYYQKQGAIFVQMQQQGEWVLLEFKCHEVKH